VVSETVMNEQFHQVRDDFLQVGQARVQARHGYFAGRPVKEVVDYDRFSILA